MRDCTTSGGPRRARPRTFQQRALAATLASLVACGGAQALDADGCPLGEGFEATVAEVIDGDTMRLADGRELRLIGSLAPRPAYSAKPWRIETKAREALSALVAGRPVRIATSGGADRHGRLFAHVFAESDGRLVWVQGEMLSQGLGRAYGLPGHFACESRLTDRERAARKAKSGVWADRAFQVAEAADVRSLLRAQGSFKIVSGVVRKVERIGNRLYVNFGDDWRTDFTAGATVTPDGVGKAWADRAQALAGWRVEVRGWIERRYGPFVEIWSASQIEIVDRAENTPP